MEVADFIWLIILQIFFIGLNAIFACSEIAIVTVNENKLEKLATLGNKRALRLKKLIEQPTEFLSTIQVGITLINLLSSAVATENFSDSIVQWFVANGINLPVVFINIISVSLITILLTYFTVLFGELVPKRIAMKNAEKLALDLSGLVYILSKIFSPAVWLFTVSVNGVLKVVGISPDDEGTEDPEEEIRLMLDAGKEKGIIQPDEQNMIQNIFEFDDITAVEIMTHRTEVSLLWLEETDEQWEEKISKSRYSIYPVCRNSFDDVIGILYIKDYFRLKNRTRESVMKNAVQKAYFVPESVRADILFRNMKQTRNHFAIVVDEYGGMSGIITMNDLLEQLVGDLEDDILAPTDQPEIEYVEPNSWKMQGTVQLTEISKQLGIPLPVTEYDTLGGMFFGILGEIPDDGSTPQIEKYGLKINAISIKERKLERAIVHLTEKSQSIENEGRRE